MDKLRCIDNQFFNPFQNLAMEEFLVKNYSENIFMLWQNEATVVVGKHQNALAEINHQFLEENKIKLARRLSGGGTVYHDHGNLNFTFILNGEEGKLVDFGKYTNLIVEFLNQAGVPAQSNQRHDITINGLKVSGNAEHIFKNRVLHHGTLLFNSDLERLNKAINPASIKYIDKAVQSVRSKVTNIRPFLNQEMNIRQFKKNLMEFVLYNTSGSQIHKLNKIEWKEVMKLSIEKYASWEWIYGYSPQYEVRSMMISGIGEINVRLLVKKGIITESEIKNDSKQQKIMDKINAEIMGLKHNKYLLYNKLNKPEFLSGLKGLSLKEFVDHLF